MAFMIFQRPIRLIRLACGHCAAVIVQKPIDHIDGLVKKRAQYVQSIVIARIDDPLIANGRLQIPRHHILCVRAIHQQNAQNARIELRQIGGEIARIAEFGVAQQLQIVAPNVLHQIHGVGEGRLRAAHHAHADHLEYGYAHEAIGNGRTLFGQIHRHVHLHGIRHRQNGDQQLAIDHIQVPPAFGAGHDFLAWHHHTAKRRADLLAELVEAGQDVGATAWDDAIG